MGKVLAIFLIAGLLTGCGSFGQAEAVTTTGVEETESSIKADADKITAENYVISLRIVDGAEEGELILAGENAQDVYSLSADGIEIYLDDKRADASALEDGMMAVITYSGMDLEEFPGSLYDVERIAVYSRGTEQNPGGGTYDLCGLYLQVLDDLWDRDAGLNSNINYVSVDLSEAPGDLSQGEKAAVAWLFGKKHQVEALMLTNEELAEEGYLTEVEQSKGLYEWKDGVAFQIYAEEWDKDEVYSLPVIKFGARKWRSPLGAYGFSDCTAVWPEMGTWSQYNIGAEYIS